MSECQYLKDCEFVLRYVSRVKPHWDDFVSLYCRGDFQDICKRKKWFMDHGTKPSPDLMPTGNRVPAVVDRNK